MPKKNKVKIDFSINKAQLEKTIDHAVQNHLQTQGVDVECINPSCKKVFAVTLGQNVCPFCQGIITVTL